MRCNIHETKPPIQLKRDIVISTRGIVSANYRYRFKNANTFEAYECLCAWVPVGITIRTGYWGRAKPTQLPTSKAIGNKTDFIRLNLNGGRIAKVNRDRLSCRVQQLHVLLPGLRHMPNATNTSTSQSKFVLETRLQHCKLSQTKHESFLLLFHSRLVLLSHTVPLKI